MNFRFLIPHSPLSGGNPVDIDLDNLKTAVPHPGEKDAIDFSKGFIKNIKEDRSTSLGSLTISFFVFKDKEVAKKMVQAHEIVPV